MRKKVLVADDSRLAQMMSRLVLRRLDCDVLTALDGAQAVDITVAQRPDLVLMDVVMPRMDGFAALRAIRSIDGIRDTPVIMLTTRGEAELLEAGYELGCNDYITKPVDGAVLLAKITSVLGA